MKYDNRKKADKLIRSSAAEYLTYVAAAGENGVELRYEEENIWLTQKMLSVLYGVSTSVINQHIKNVKVDNERAVQFRKWANQIVKDFTIKGWVMDDERLKNGGSILTEKYFEE